MQYSGLADEDIRFMALAIAAISHGTQTYDGTTYVKHLLDVAGVLEEFGLDSPHMVAAALLHDTLEDTDLTEAELLELFPQPVPQLVIAVTNIPLKANRRERNANMYAKVRSMPAAVALKLCDRIANVRAAVTLMSSSPGTRKYFDMYLGEYEGFCEALRYPGEFDTLWAELDDLLGVDMEVLASTT